MDKGSGSGIFPDSDPGDPKRPDPDPQHCFKSRNGVSQGLSRMLVLNQEAICPNSVILKDM